jgi:hypothetical protein
MGLAVPARRSALGPFPMGCQLRKQDFGIPDYFGGCSSPFSQPNALSVLIGSGWSHSKHWNIRGPFQCEGAATKIRYAPH